MVWHLEVPTPDDRGPFRPSFLPPHTPYTRLPPAHDKKEYPRKEDDGLTFTRLRPIDRLAPASPYPLEIRRTKFVLESARASYFISIGIGIRSAPRLGENEGVNFFAAGTLLRLERSVGCALRVPHHLPSFPARMLCASTCEL